MVQDEQCEQCCHKNRQNLAKARRCGAGCISACLLGKFFSGRLRSHLVGRLRCSPLDTGAFWLDFAYFSGNTGDQPGRGGEGRRPTMSR